MTMHACSCLSCPRACERSARPWDWLPCEWMRPITNEATSQTRRVQPWDWLPCEWMSPFPKEATSKTRRDQPWDWLPWTWMNPFLHKTTSKTCPPYNRLLPAASAHFAPGPVDTSSLVPLPQWFFDCRGLWTRVLAMVPCFVPCPLKLGLWTGLFVCSFARGALAGCMWCSTR